MLSEFQVQVAALVNPDVILIPIVGTGAFVRAGLYLPIVAGEPYGFGWGRSERCKEKGKDSPD